jgi:CheY-like chemotaxis protein
MTTDAPPESPPLLLAYQRDERIRLLAIVIAGFGYRLETCDSAQRAVERIEQARPAAALVDVRLPEAESLCQQASDHQVPVLLLTANGEPEGTAETAAGWFDTADDPAHLLRQLRELLPAT